MAICKFCGKECKNRGLKQHERLCHKNPDRDMALTDILKKNGADTCRKINARIKNRNESTRRKREFVCQGCGKKFYLNLTDNEVLYKKYRNRRYCSPRCGKIYTKPTVISPDTRKKISEGCRKHWAEYRKTHQHKKKEYKILTCRICGKKYTVKEYRSLYYCSDICRNIAYGKHRSGNKKISEDTRMKLSLAGQKSAKVQAEYRRSRNEKYFCSLCEEKFEHVEHNIPMFNGWDADVIVHDIKVAVLWNGAWHYKKITDAHSLSQVQNRDRIKIQEIEKAGYAPYIIRDDGKYNPKFVEEQFQLFLKTFNIE